MISGSVSLRPASGRAKEAPAQVAVVAAVYDRRIIDDLFFTARKRLLDSLRLRSCGDGHRPPRYNRTPAKKSGYRGSPRPPGAGSPGPRGPVNGPRQSPIPSPGGRLRPQRSPLVPKLHLGTQLSAQLHCAGPRRLSKKRGAFLVPRDCRRNALVRAASLPSSAKHKTSVILSEETFRPSESKDMAPLTREHPLRWL